VVLFTLSLSLFSPFPPSNFDTGDTGDDGTNGDNSDDDSDNGDGDANGKPENGDDTGADVVCVVVDEDVGAEGDCDTEHKDADIMPFSVAETMALGTVCRGGLGNRVLVWVEVETEGRGEVDGGLTDFSVKNGGLVFFFFDWKMERMVDRQDILLFLFFLRQV